MDSLLFLYIFILFRYIKLLLNYVIIICMKTIANSDDYIMERRLKSLDEGLHRRFRDTVFVCQQILSKYRLLFPEYTDHSELHSLTVIDSCNKLIGLSQIDRLNPDELYVLLTGVYLHDVGMGISEKDYEQFKDRFHEKEFFQKYPNATKADFVRIHHQELGAAFMDKYSDVFDIPSPQHLFAIKEVIRGHRKTDLYSREEYPVEYELPNGNTVCLPYLAALIRISDEIDVVATRNPLVLYDIETLTDEIEIAENMKLQAVKNLELTDDAFVISCQTDDEALYESLVAMAEKMQHTLDYCRDVVHTRTSYHISQKNVILKRL